MQKVKLRAEIGSGFWAIIHSLIERFVFGRFQFFKNNPRGNYVFIRACITALAMSGGFVLALVCVRGGQEVLRGNTVTLTSLLDFLVQRAASLRLKDSGQYLLGFLSMVSIVYWGSSNLFNSKWLYCQGLYNESIKLQCRDRLGRLTYEVLANALAMDLIVLDLWAHRSFWQLFYQELSAAIVTNTRGPFRRHLLTRMRSGDITENEAMTLLENRQELLFKKVSAEEGSLEDLRNKFPQVVELSRQVAASIAELQRAMPNPPRTRGNAVPALNRLNTELNRLADRYGQFNEALTGLNANTRI